MANDVQLKKKAAVFRKDVLKKLKHGKQLKWKIYEIKKNSHQKNSLISRHNKFIIIIINQREDKYPFLQQTKFVHFLCYLICIYTIRSSMSIFKNVKRLIILYLIKYVTIHYIKLDKLIFYSFFSREKQFQCKTQILL